MIRQEETSEIGGGQMLAAVGILVGLAVAAPLLGILAIPFAAADTIARVARR
jgi:hypothetical protein